MSSNPPNQGSSTSNYWLSSILRPRASSVSVESCLKLHNADPTSPLDAQPIIHLLSASQPLATRCRHLKAFADLCKSYKFTHLDNVFFAVQDILEPTMNRDARHIVFEFLLACINGQYDDLGMTRVTFYSSIKNHDNWEDFGDMYDVLFALCKGGRDVSGFEKNIDKLLITWLGLAVQHAPPQHVRWLLTTSASSFPESIAIPFMRNILHLLTAVIKFNVAMYEEPEITLIIRATLQALLASNHPEDIKACLTLADVVVRYRFVPLSALTSFLEILCVSVMLPEQLVPSRAESPWSIFMNLLRSHTKHSAILKLCQLAETSDDNLKLSEGAILLLSETAWGSRRQTASDIYMVPNHVLLICLRRGIAKGNARVNAAILRSLCLFIDNEENKVVLLEWDIIWDILDQTTSYLLQGIHQHIIDVLHKFPNTDAVDLPTQPSVVHQFVRFLNLVYQMHMTKSYTGPVDRFMKVIAALRHHVSNESALVLLNYYENEHLLLPSADDWESSLLDIVQTFFIPKTVARAIRLRVLSIVMDVYLIVKDLCSDNMCKTIVYPMVAGTPHESDPVIRQKSVRLIVAAMLYCTDDAMFDQLLDILHKCSCCRCFTDASPSSGETTPMSPEETESRDILPLQRSNSQSNAFQKHQRKKSGQIQMPRSNTASPLSTNSPIVARDKPSTEGSFCSGVPAICGLIQLFEALLPSKNGEACSKVFGVITQIANSADDLHCPYGGPTLAALDLLLRLRCSHDHRLQVVPDDVVDNSECIALIRRFRASEENPGGQKDGVWTNKNLGLFSRTVVSFKGASDNPELVVLPMEDILKAYRLVLTQSSHWDVVFFVLKRLPYQLSYKHLFCGATEELNKLRRMIVMSLNDHKFLKQVTRLPPTMRRNDLNVYAYKILVVLVSYRRIFNKRDQDEIVYAFFIGITQVTASTKPCIHALTVCCHELPLSVAKMLNEILQRMSQIISVSGVSVHILEFLSGLARLPKLYANFTGDTYKLVFAIALNYLQHSQSANSAHPPQPSPLGTSGGATGSPVAGSPMQIGNQSVVSPTVSASQPQDSLRDSSNQGALSQYVLIMAYLVITVWFTAVPLRERRKHVSFIIQRLLGANPIGKPLDEQTLTCIDMLSRFSFADVSLSPEKSLVSQILMGDPAVSGSPAQSGPPQPMQTWVYGHTLLTIKAARARGWVELMIRRPSGTVSMMCCVENRFEPNSIDYKTLPALLMMQYTPEILASRLQKGDEDPASTSQREGSGLGITFDENTSNTQAKESTKQDDENAANTNVGSPDPVATEPQSSPNTAQATGSAQTNALFQQMLSDPNDAGTTSSDYLLDPRFLYLQLCNYPDLTRMIDMTPPLPDDAATARSLGILDKIPVVDFHKIGVLYVGKGQRTEVEILANTHGSPEYVKFLNGMGTVERLRGHPGNTGGLDRERDTDGRYAYFWQDDVTRVLFHVATMMPTDLEREPQCNTKKRHIGNDFVTIVYNDSGEDYAFDTLPSQFNYINIVVSPHSLSSSKTSDSQPQSAVELETTFFRVEMQSRGDMPDIGPISEPKLISAQSLSDFVRQMALHANTFSQVFLQRKSGRHEYVSNWRERLRHIRRIRERVSKSEHANLAAAAAAATGVTASSNTRNHGTHVPAEMLLDFTRYT